MRTRFAGSDKIASRSRANAAEKSVNARKVLWIDDEVGLSDAAVVSLALEGFLVDCAVSGRAGLEMARTHPYHAIILDLHLPDVTGLSVLHAIRAETIRTPIVVLTGFADVNSAVEAMKLGATDYRGKPILSDELVRTLRDVGCDLTQQPHVPHITERSFSPPPDADEVSLSRLLASFEELAVPTASLNNARALEPVGARESIQPALVSLLVGTLTRQNLPIGIFMRCAKALRQALAFNGSQGESIAHVRQVLEDASIAPCNPNSPLVYRAIARLEADLEAHVRPAAPQLAREIGVHPMRLKRLFWVDTGMGFRDWRRGLAMRLAVRRLGELGINIAEIAYQLGFEHPSQFDREFRQSFGISPRRLRRLL